MPTQDSPTLNPEATELDKLTRILADESERPMASVFWRDAFCFECGMNECVEGTAQQLAEHLIGLNWNMVWPRNTLICPRCQEAPLPTNAYWEQMELGIAKWKESIDA